MASYRLTVTGIVQGVGFRYFSMKTAIHYGLKGYVKNLSNGTVFIEVEGEEVIIEQFIEWCKVGPRGATVEDITIEVCPEKNHQSFIIS